MFLEQISTTVLIINELFEVFNEGERYIFPIGEAGQPALIPMKYNKSQYSVNS